MRTAVAAVVAVALAATAAAAPAMQVSACPPGARTYTVPAGTYESLNVTDTGTCAVKAEAGVIVEGYAYFEPPTHGGSVTITGGKYGALWFGDWEEQGSSRDRLSGTITVHGAAFEPNMTAPLPAVAADKFSLIRLPPGGPVSPAVFVTAVNVELDAVFLPEITAMTGIAVATAGGSIPAVTIKDVNINITVHQEATHAVHTLSGISFAGNGRDAVINLNAVTVTLASKSTAAGVLFAAEPAADVIIARLYASLGTITVTALFASAFMMDGVRPGIIDVAVARVVVKGGASAFGVIIETQKRVPAGGQTFAVGITAGMVGCERGEATGIKVIAPANVMTITLGDLFIDTKYEHGAATGVRVSAPFVVTPTPVTILGVPGVTAIITASVGFAALVDFLPSATSAQPFLVRGITAVVSGDTAIGIESGGVLTVQESTIHVGSTGLRSRGMGIVKYSNGPLTVIKSVIHAKASNGTAVGVRCTGDVWTKLFVSMSNITAMSVNDVTGATYARAVSVKGASKNVTIDLYTTRAVAVSTGDASAAAVHSATAGTLDFFALNIAGGELSTDAPTNPASTIDLEGVVSAESNITMRTVQTDPFGDYGLVDYSHDNVLVPLVPVVVSSAGAFKAVITLPATVSKMALWLAMAAKSPEPLLPGAVTCAVKPCKATVVGLDQDGLLAKLKKDATDFDVGTATRITYRAKLSDGATFNSLAAGIVALTSAGSYDVAVWPDRMNGELTGLAGFAVCGPEMVSAQSKISGNLEAAKDTLGTGWIQEVVAGHPSITPAPAVPGTPAPDRVSPGVVIAAVFAVLIFVAAVVGGAYLFLRRRRGAQRAGIDESDLQVRGRGGYTTV